LRKCLIENGRWLLGTMSGYHAYDNMHTIGMADEEGDNEETDASGNDDNRTDNDANLDPATAHGPSSFGSTP
jgi:hypothetical protein